MTNSLARDLYDRQVRCMKHLIDLKKAGHSPKTTELRIGSDSLAVAVMRGQSYGSIGSPGSMCTEVTFGRGSRSTTGIGSGSST